MRGVPTPVVDVARLLGGEQAEVARFVAVRTEHGPVAFATGPVLGIRAVSGRRRRHRGAARRASSRLVAGVGTIGAEPLLLLQSMRVVPDEVWAAAAGAGGAVDDRRTRGGRPGSAHLLGRAAGLDLRRQRRAAPAAGELDRRAAARGLGTRGLPGPARRAAAGRDEIDRADRAS